MCSLYKQHRIGRYHYCRQQHGIEAGYEVLCDFLVAACLLLPLLLLLHDSACLLLLLQVGQLRHAAPCMGGRFWQAEHVSKQQPVCTSPGVLLHVEHTRLRRKLYVEFV
jgi:hypothetical protein